MLSRCSAIAILVALTLVPATALAADYRGMPAGWPNYAGGYYAGYAPLATPRRRYYAARPVTVAYANPAYAAGYGGAATANPAYGCRGYGDYRRRPPIGPRLPPRAITSSRRPRPIIRRPTAAAPQAAYVSRSRTAYYQPQAAYYQPQTAYYAPRTHHPPSLFAIRSEPVVCDQPRGRQLGGQRSGRVLRAADAAELRPAAIRLSHELRRKCRSICTGR